MLRCAWGTSTDDYVRYHDDEWGHPTRDDRLLFEKLCLEGFQSGLSWLTILRRRQAFRRVFHAFDIARVAAMTDVDVEMLVGDASIIRHRGKIESTINNAKRTLEVATELGSLGALVWRFEPDDQDRVIDSVTPESRALAAELKGRGFTYVGPTTAYAFMQAMGMVNDHHPGCSFYSVVADARAEFTRP